MTNANQLTMLLTGAALTIAWTAAPADGLIVMDASAPANAVDTSSPPTGTYADFGYWNNMLGPHTYLGNGYLLSTNHAAAIPTSIDIGGTTYNRVAQQRLTQPGNASILTDLWVWKIDGGGNPLPNLPTLRPIVSAPVTGETTLIIGDGFSRANGPTFWDVTYTAGADNDTWAATGTEAGADAKGFLTGTSQPKLWGTNTVFDANEDIVFSSTNVTRGYTVNFSTVDGTSLEAQATNDDSGGPVFVKRGGEWVLTGLMHAVDLFEGQPGSPGYAGIYHYTNPSDPGEVLSSQTYISDLSDYTDQLVAFGVTVPEPTGIALGGVIAIGLLARRRRGA